MANVIKVNTWTDSVCSDAAPWEKIFASHENAPPVVVHLAARAHILNDSEKDPLSAFRKANVDTALTVAKHAFSRGVQRFVFVSSIGAVGDQSWPDVPLAEDAPCRPASDYGLSKREAELALQELAFQFKAQLIILRPPLVYGRGALGNLSSMKRWIKSGLPLPFAGIENRRSLIHVENLCHAILRCAQIEHRDSKLFHVRDIRDYSTPEIIRLAADVMNCRERLFRLPERLLRRLSLLPGRTRSMKSLLVNLQVDDRLIRRELGFLPKELPFEL